MYVMQRWTGYVAFIYIIQHVIRQRFTGRSLPEHPYEAFHKVQVELSNPWMLAVYVIAILAVCWHFSYGIWLFAAKWGITPGVKSRKRFGYACLAIGVVLAGMGLASLYAFVGPDYKNTPENISPPQSRLVRPSTELGAPGLDLETWVSNQTAYSGASSRA